MQLRYMKFPDIQWDDFTPECKGEWARIRIADKVGYEKVAKLLCHFCDKKDHWTCKCPLALPFF